METIHQYYKGKTDGLLVLVQVDPEQLTGLELVINEEGDVVKTKRKFDKTIYDDLAEDGFENSSALEFQLYLNGIK